MYTVQSKYINVDGIQYCSLMDFVLAVWITWFCISYSEWGRREQPPRAEESGQVPSPALVGHSGQQVSVVRTLLA